MKSTASTRDGLQFLRVESQVTLLTGGLAVVDPEPDIAGKEIHRTVSRIRSVFK